MPVHTCAHKCARTSPCGLRMRAVDDPERMALQDGRVHRRKEEARPDLRDKKPVPRTWNSTSEGEGCGPDPEDDLRPKAFECKQLIMEALGARMSCTSCSRAWRREGEDEEENWSLASHAPAGGVG